MIDYVALKTLHVCCVLASGAGFAARFALVLAGSPLARIRLARVAPHVVDSLLLASAVAMAWQARLVPLEVGWITAKIAGLVVYVGLGAVALQRGRTPATRRAAGLAAFAVFLYIASVAVTKSPWGFVPRLG